MRITLELVAGILNAHGVSADPVRAKSHAALTATLLDASAAAFGELAFEEEPAAFIAELRRAAP